MGGLDFWNDILKKGFMKKICLLLAIIFTQQMLSAQHFEAGLETTMGPAFTAFNGDLSKMVGFSELEISQEDVDEAFERYDLEAPRWLKELFPGVRMEVGGDVSRQLTRNVKSVRFFARYRFIGGSFTISDPRLSPQPEGRKLKNQWKAVRLSLAGDAEGLAEHLALVALEDETRVKPFFNNRYDLEAWVDLKKMFLNEVTLAEWGRRSKLDFEVTAGLRFTADPSPVLDLGNVLFVKEELDALLEGGVLTPVENTTDQIAEAIQNVVFGKFRDPRVVPSLGWFVRGALPVNFGGDLSLLIGAELSVSQHISIKGTQPMYSAYGFGGVRWSIFNKDKNRR